MNIVIRPDLDPAQLGPHLRNNNDGRRGREGRVRCLKIGFNVHLRWGVDFLLRSLFSQVPDKIPENVN